jgi:hypothetical protein
MAYVAVAAKMARVVHGIVKTGTASGLQYQMPGLNT